MKHPRAGAHAPRFRRLPTDPIGVAVVGLGYWGPNLVRNLHELAEFDVRAICDTQPEALEDTLRRYPGLDATTELRDVLANEAVEAVLIATPVSTHFELIAQALEAGRHVFVEKPLAQSSDDARAAIELARAQQRVLMPGHTFLYSPAVNAVKALIDAGDLGAVHFISTSRVNLGIHQADVSVVWDLAPHDFSILLYWLGEAPVRVSALTRGFVMPDVPDVAFINMEFPSGTIAHTELSWLAPSKLRRTAVVGSRKMVVYDDMSVEPVRVFDSGVVLPSPATFGEYRLSYRTGDIVSPKIAAAEPLALELADFARAIRSGTEPRASATLGLQVVEMIEAVESAVAERVA